MTRVLTRKIVQKMIREEWEKQKPQPRDDSWDNLGEPDWSMPDNPPKKKPVEEAGLDNSGEGRFFGLCTRDSKGISEKEIVRLFAMISNSIGRSKWQSILNTYIERYLD